MLPKVLLHLPASVLHRSVFMPQWPHSTQIEYGGIVVSPTRASSLQSLSLPLSAQSCASPEEGAEQPPPPHTTQSVWWVFSPEVKHGLWNTTQPLTDGAPSAASLSVVTVIKVEGSQFLVEGPFWNWSLTRSLETQLAHPFVFCA